jgi:diguanylate cyclase (GGDEF)-like protein
VSTASANGGWRLLVLVARVRWLAVALTAAFAYVLDTPHGAPRWLLLPAAGGALFNVAIIEHGRNPRIDARTVTLLSVAADFAWVSGIAVGLALSGTLPSTAAGFVVVGSEAGLLLGWRGAAGAVAAGGAAMATTASLGAHVGGFAVAPAYLLYGIGMLLIAAACAAVASSELRRRHRESELQAASLARLARTDHLTGLANALALEETLQSLGTQAYALMLVDVDDMSWANQVYGHMAGDEMLHAVARVLSAVAEAEDLAVRLIEDKFVLLLREPGRERTIEIAERVRQAMHAVAVSAGRLRVSIGCAWSLAGVESHEVMSRADDAVLAAKAAGGDRVEVQALGEGPGRWRMRATVEKIISADRGVYSVYQRIVRLRDGGAVAWEALSRPHDWPADTDVEALFLAAHRMGHSRDLDWRCRMNALWEAARLDAPLFINVNSGALLDPVHGVDQMELVCKWAGRDPQSVVLELSERDGTPDLRRLRTVLAEYRAAGFRFALDDLGEGQTSFEMVLAARPEFFKLARPLVQAAQRDPGAHAAVRALVGFAHDIGSAVIAEGIEDEPTRDLCIELDIDFGQGWLFGRPQPADRLLST